MATKKVKVENVGGVTSFSFPLSPGVTELRGVNGAGKTSTMKATSRLFGADVPLEVRDGAEHGTVECEGVKLVVRKVVRATGEADVKLAEVGALAALIDPLLKDSDAAARARIRALLSLSKLPITDEAVKTLAGDDEVAARSMMSIRNASITDLLQAAERVRLEAHGLKREAEKAGEQAAGEAATLDAAATAAKEAVGFPIQTPTAEAEADERRATEEYARAGLLARQRDELVAQQDEVRASLGDCPTMETVNACLHQAKLDFDAACRAAEGDRKALDELQRLVAAAENRLMSSDRGKQAAEGYVVTVEEQCEAQRQRIGAWKYRATVLDRPVTGPTKTEVDALAVKAEMARITSQAARLSDAYRANHLKAADAHQRAADALARAAFLEVVATTTGDRLGDLLSGTAAEGLTVQNGRLAVLVDGKALDFETRQSDGQRARVAFKIASKAFAGRVVPLDGKLWASWNPARQEEIAKIAAEESMYVITEAPTDDPVLGSRHLPTAPLFEEK